MTESHDPSTIGSLLNQFFSRLAPDDQTYVPRTSLLHLDEQIRPLDESWFVIVAGVPGMGRSALATHFLTGGQRPGLRLMYTIDQTPAMVTARLLTANARVDANRILTGHLNARDLERLSGAAGNISEMNLQIVDAYAMTIDDLTAHARSQAEQPISIIVVDGIELIPSVYLDQAIIQLRFLSRELRCPVVTTFPINPRSINQRPNHRPMLSDLDLSSAAESAADVILSVYRDDFYNKETDWQGIMEIDVLKQKNGPLGRLRVQFHSAHVRLNDLVD